MNDNEIKIELVYLLFNGISTFLGYLMPKSILMEGQ